jgi:hypothetical protein
MKLNKKKLNRILPQINAYLNVAVMMDSPENPGSIDFIFQPRAKGVEHGYLNKLTCSMNDEEDLFGDGVVETLGSPLMINITQLRDSLNCDESESEPELKDGVVNGIKVLADAGYSGISQMSSILSFNWDSVKDDKLVENIKFSMSRIDYELLAATVTPFVSHDITRYFMNGYSVDFGKGDDFINFVATDGRKLSLCKFPCKHKTEGNSILNPLNLFIPRSAYSRVEWFVGKGEQATFTRIRTEDYDIVCRALPIEGAFPNYPRVIPTKEENSEWMNLNAESARKAYASIKGLIDNSRFSSVKNCVFFDAEDPKHIKLTVPCKAIEIDGEASRPMRLYVSWDDMNAAFLGASYTRFMLKNVNKAILSEKSKAVPGTTMFITKVAMPLQYEEYDEWGIVNLAQARTNGGGDSKESCLENSEDPKPAVTIEDDDPF